MSRLRWIRPDPRGWRRQALWLTLGAVVVLRFFYPPASETRVGKPGDQTAETTVAEPVRRFPAGPPPDFGPGGERPFPGGPGRDFRGGPGPDFRGGRGPGFRGGGRFRRPPTRVQPAVGPIPPDLWRLQIDVAPADAEVLRGYHWRGWGGDTQERPEVFVTVREGGIVYTNVALHLKGSAGSFRPFDDKPALTLHFSKRAPDQEFHGLQKISLNNSVQDPSFLSEAICRELFETAGVPVPRVNHVTVVLNGRDLGLYVLAEGWGKPFLRRHFKSVGGNLYDGGFLKDIDTDLETNSGDQREDRSDLQRLREAVFEPDPARRQERLAQVLDLDRFMTFVCMEVLLCHWDGYAMNRNNYRLFHDLGTDRMIFLPHGLDQMFGVARSYPQSSIFPRLQGVVAQAVLEAPENRTLYLDRMRRLLTKVLPEDKVIQRVRELSRRIRPTLAAYGEDVAEEHDLFLEQLCQRIAERARSVAEQLDGPKR